MSIKTKYSLLYFLYCIGWCCLAGFVAVFLQYKGVSNTLIGVVTGVGCVSSLFLAPFLSNYVSSSDKVTIQSVFTFFHILILIAFAAITFLPLPSTVIMIIYTIIYALTLSCGPLMQMLASSYMAAGIEVNFGLARGLGSASWAITALVFGTLIDYSSPNILAIGSTVFLVCTIVLMNTMPKMKSSAKASKKSRSFSSVAKNYPIYFIFLLGFAFMMAGSTSLGTYLINTVTNLGGTTSFYGVATFIMALSEMPVMALTPRLMRKYRSTTLIAVAAVCYMIRNFTISLAPNLVILCIGMIFQGLSYGLLTAVITYYVMYNLNPESQNMGQTMITMMTSGFGSTIGNLLGGTLQDNYGLNAMYIFACALTAIGACITFGGKLLSTRPKFANEIKR